jgi:hypothetical protein
MATYGRFWVATEAIRLIFALVDPKPEVLLPATPSVGISILASAWKGTTKFFDMFNAPPTASTIDLEYTFMHGSRQYSNPHRRVPVGAP